MNLYFYYVFQRKFLENKSGYEDIIYLDIDSKIYFVILDRNKVYIIE